jgi:hypothetical protein
VNVATGYAAGADAGGSTIDTALSGGTEVIVSAAAATAERSGSVYFPALFCSAAYERPLRIE